MHMDQPKGHLSTLGALNVVGIKVKSLTIDRLLNPLPRTTFVSVHGARESDTLHIRVGRVVSFFIF